MKYDQDTRVRLSAQFRDFNEDLTDPDTVTLKLRTPAGAETSHVYGVDGNVIKDGTGLYHYDLDFTVSGQYAYRWVGDGTLWAAAENVLKVRESRFDAP